jgi:hypothetical protein
MKKFDKYTNKVNIKQKQDCQERGENKWLDRESHLGPLCH